MNTLFVSWTCLLLWSQLAPTVIAKTLPEASSTLLRMHKLYQQQAPHDTTLYDILEVAPNATAAQISKSYRVLSRKYHPDKATDRAENLHSVQQAYEILKDDVTRLPYHQYGLTDVSDAAFLLTGARSPKSLSANQEKLLRLMGYIPGQKLSHDERILYLAANIVERIRPLVEDIIPSSALTDSIAQECAILKRLPLGAQILRCVGRAYRHAGQQVLLQDRFKLAGEVTNVLRQYKHKTQYILEAAAVGGKLLVTANRWKGRKFDLAGPVAGTIDTPRIEYEFPEDDADDDPFDDNSIDEAEYDKAKKVELESLQVEALWKISKFHLDQTIHLACKHVLDGKYFFFPSHMSSNTEDWYTQGDGWVTARGQTISVSVGRLRAASALVLIGDTLVKCSKESSL